MTAEPSPGPYDIWGEDEEVPGVPCIEIGRGKVPSREAKSLCLVRSTLDERDNFVLTDQDWANAKLFAASWATAAERDRLVAVNEGLVALLQEALPHVEQMALEVATGPIRGPVEKLVGAMEDAILAGLTDSTVEAREIRAVNPEPAEVE